MYNILYVLCILVYYYIKYKVGWLGWSLGHGEQGPCYYVSVVSSILTCFL